MSILLIATSLTMFPSNKHLILGTSFGSLNHSHPLSNKQLETDPSLLGQVPSYELTEGFVNITIP